MHENQNIEFKQSWRDEYLKWISGFANASGGKIYIGIDDTGKVIGLRDAQKLLEDIPNKIVNYLGIVVQVNLLKKNTKHYIEIIVEPSSVPISYRGTYHYRSGSTKQELKGNALQLFGKRPSRFFPAVSFKIGRFINGDDDLRFQDVIEGNILQMVDNVMDVLKSKYLISPIHYEGLQRIEKLEVPEEALREALFYPVR